MGGHPQHVCSRVGGRGRHSALHCHGVAVRTRRQVRPMPDLQQRTLALRTAPRSHRSRLPSHVRRPDARCEDAAVISTLGMEASINASTTRGEKVSRKLRPLAALAMADVAHRDAHRCGALEIEEERIALDRRLQEHAPQHAALALPSGEFDRPWPDSVGSCLSIEAVQTPARVNVTCVTPLGEEVASTS